jgi:hypothetical protein
MMTKTGHAAALVGLLSLIACGGGGGDRVTQTTSTTSSVATTTVASTTTTTIAAQTFTAAMRAENTPCVAPSDAPVSCRFVASTTGGQAPFTYAWDFRTPANNTQVNGQTVSPTFGCGLSTGTTSFDVQITLTVTDNAGARATAMNNQQIARAKGACGTPP